MGWISESHRFELGPLLRAADAVRVAWADAASRGRRDRAAELSDRLSTLSTLSTWEIVDCRDGSILPRAKRGGWRLVGRALEEVRELNGGEVGSRYRLHFPELRAGSDVAVFAHQRWRLGSIVGVEDMPRARRRRYFVEWHNARGELHRHRYESARVVDAEAFLALRWAAWSGDRVARCLRSAELGGEVSR